VFESKLVTYLQ